MKIIGLYFGFSLIMAIVNWMSVPGLRDNMVRLLDECDEKLSYKSSKVLLRIVLAIIMILTAIPVELYALIKKMKGS